MINKKRILIFDFWKLLALLLIIYTYFGGVQLKAEARVYFTEGSISPQCGSCDHPNYDYFKEVHFDSPFQGQIFYPGSPIHIKGYIKTNEKASYRCKVGGKWTWGKVTGALFNMILGKDINGVSNNVSCTTIWATKCTSGSYPHIGIIKRNDYVLNSGGGNIQHVGNEESHKSSNGRIYFDKTFTIPVDWANNDNNSEKTDYLRIYPVFSTCNSQDIGVNIGSFYLPINIRPNKINGQCAIGHYYCLKGNSINHHYNSSSSTYTWQCQGVNGGTTARCVQRLAINGRCALIHNQCNRGASRDIPDTSTQWRWQCVGTNGGSNITCSEDKPTLSFTANPNPVNYNTASNLRWTTSHVQSCYASGAWRGWKSNTGGSQSTGPLTSSKTYSLECWNSQGNSTGRKTVTVNVNRVNGQCASRHNQCNRGASQDIPDTSTQWKWQCLGTNGGSNITCSEDKPTLFFTANPSSVDYGKTSNLSWTTSHVQSCYASGDWRGWKSNTGGSQSTDSLTSSKTYSLECWNSQGDSTGRKTVTVNVNAVNGECNNEDAKTYDCHATSFTKGIFCNKGTPNPTKPIFPNKGTSTTWQCLGLNGGNNDTCTASVQAITSGKCGSANGQSFYTRPTSNLCNNGTPSTLNYNSNTSKWTWTCSGNCKTSVNCSANKKEQKTEDWTEVAP